MLLLLSMTVLRFGSWNVCGLAGEAGVAHVIQDFEKYQLTVLGIKETKVRSGRIETVPGGHQLLLFDQERVKELKLLHRSSTIWGFMRSL